MGILRILKNFRTHPLTRNKVISACWRYMKWQLHVRLFNYPVIYPFVGNTQLIVSKGMRASTGNVYCGLQEFEEMSFLLHFLSERDLFVDVGANIGTFTLLASGHRKSRSIAIEPIPATFEHLKKNTSINSLEPLVHLHNKGLGAEKKMLKFTSMWDTYNNVITEDAVKNEKYFIEVEVVTLDSIVGDQNPGLMKIDVEGFEYEVLVGGSNTLKKESLKAIIIELNGTGKRYGHSDQEIHEILAGNGFSKYRYSPFERKLTPSPDLTESNAIYLRDVDFVRKKVEAAEPVTILNRTY